jgi:hypothetical protein
MVARRFSVAQIVLNDLVAAGYGDRNDCLRNDSGFGVDWFSVRFGWNCSDGPKGCERAAKQTPARIAASEKVTVKRFRSNLDIPGSALTAPLFLIQYNFFGNPIRFAKLGGMPHHSFFPDQPARRLG